MSGRKWAEPELLRGQYVVTTLDDSLALDHRIRVVDALLEQVDWSPWEDRYRPSRRGQPPIHPRLLAGCILYGLMVRVRSSRQLEDATRERLDFQWFLGKRSIDHATFAKFRTDFGDLLSGLNDWFAQRLCEAVENALNLLVCDGTRIRANSNVHGGLTGETLKRHAGHVAQLLNDRLAQMAQGDSNARKDEEAPEKAALDEKIEGVRAQLAQYERAAKVADERDAARRRKEGVKATAVQVPLTDPDAMVVPNKDGGFAPNYTPTAVVDAASGAIISADVPEGTRESSVVMPAVERARRLGGNPQCIVGDSAFASGPNLKKLDAESVQACMPTQTDFRDTNPANRPDPSQAVPREHWGKLPMNGGRLASSAFVYDAQRDEYRCPMGKRLTPGGCGMNRHGARYRVYECPGGKGCPLARRCLFKNTRFRTLRRDEYQDLRDTVGRRMATPEGIQLYKRRGPLIETVFARIKGHMGIRQFLLRGLDKVRTEWSWICLAYNLKLLLKLLMDSTKPPLTHASIFSHASHAR